MSDIEEKSSVIYTESPTIAGLRVGEFIQKEFDQTSPQMVLSSTYSTEFIGPHETQSYGILLDDGKSKRLFGLIRKARPLIANLWFANEARETTDKKWLLQVFGREHLEPLKALAEKLSKQFAVEINIRLESESHEYERLPSNTLPF